MALGLSTDDCAPALPMRAADTAIEEAVNATSEDFTATAPSWFTAC
jgi:hypothetical protein